MSFTPLICPPAPHQGEEQQEMQGQKNTHFQHFKTHQFTSIPSSQFHSYVPRHPHPYHPYHSHHHVYCSPQQHQQQQQAPLINNLTAIPRQNISPIQPQQLQLVLSPQHLHYNSQDQHPAMQLNFQYPFVENSALIAGLPITSIENAWVSVSRSGSNPLVSPVGSDLFPESLDLTFNTYSTSGPSTAVEAPIAMTMTGSISLTQLSPISPVSSTSTGISFGTQQKSYRIHSDKHIDSYRESKKVGTDQCDNSTTDSMAPTAVSMSPNDWFAFSFPYSPPPQSPTDLIDPSNHQSLLIQSLANLTTSSPNLVCLSPPTFSSAFVHPDIQTAFSISPDHFPGLGINVGTSSADTNNNNDNNNSSNSVLNEEDDDSAARRFQCPICSKRFLRQYNLNAHLKTHSHVRAHSCTQCDKSFLRPYDLTRHQRIHSNSKPYACNICQQIFIRNDAIWRHYRRAHPGHPDIPPARRQMGLRNSNNNIQLPQQQ